VGKYHARDIFFMFKLHGHLAILFLYYGIGMEVLVLSLWLVEALGVRINVRR